MLCQELIGILQEQSPEYYACEWDNVGLLVGDPQKEIKRVYIALDATDEAIAEAVDASADLLLTHHPMIFRAVKRITAGDFIGRKIIKLIRNDISYYAMHTNFDVKGMAQLASQRMALTGGEALDVTFWQGEEQEGIGSVGMLPQEMALAECADLVKKVFAVEQVKVFGDLQARVCKAAICPGSGKSVIGKAIRAGAQVLVTGDIDHHEGIDAAAQGLAIIDAGHYGVEKMFIPYMGTYLREHAPGLQVIEQEVREPFLYC